MTKQQQRGASEQEGLNPQSPNLPIPQSPNPPISQSPPLPSLLCWLLILTFALFFSLLALQQHYTFQTNGLDLGNVDQALWNTAQGRFLQFTLMTPIQSRLALHVEPILLLLVPFYWLNLGSPELLLIGQASVVALGAWPLYRIAVYRLCDKKGARPFSSPPAPPKGGRRKGNFPLWGVRGAGVTTNSTSLAAVLLIFPLSYLLLPTLQSAVLFDFHAVTLAPTFFLFAVWMLEQKRDAYFILFVLLAMACKEDMPLVAAMLGLSVGLSHRRWRLAGLTVGLSAVWFVVAFFIIQPRFAAGGNIQLDRYAWLGDNPVAMVQTLVTQPGLVFNHLWVEADALTYLARLFFPTAFLALLSPLTLLPMLPTLAVNLLSANPFTWRLEDFHYGAPLAPFLFISTIYGIEWLAGRLEGWKFGRWKRQSPNLPLPQSPTPPISHSPTPPISPSPHLPIPQFLLYTLLLTFTLLYHFHRGFTPLAWSFAWPEATPHHQQLARVIDTLPPDTALFTQSNLAPHLTHRPTIYTNFGYFTDPDFPAPQPVDDILLDITAFENIGGLHQFLRRELLESGEYEIVTAQDGLLHLRPSSVVRGPSSLPTAFYSFAQPTTPPDYQVTVDFGDLLRLHGYTLHFNRQEEVQITLDLEALQPVPVGLQPVIYLLDETGQPVGATTDLQPGLVWFPPSEWPVGDTVRLRFNTLPWHTRETAQYGLALGVVQGADPWNIALRQPPTPVEPPDFALRLPADGTLIKLARIEQTWHIPHGGPPPRRFRPPAVPHALDANFNHQIQLLGYSRPQIPNPQSPHLPIPPSPTLHITLYWQTLTPPPPLIRFVQLVGPDGLVYGQNDSIPDGGLYPTDLWQPGEVVIETVTVPLEPDRPAGEYRLHIGLYHPDSGQRVPLNTGGDHIEIEVGE